jgi:alkaline phosphatase D
VLYGGIDFAVLEDRKFKSAPAIVLPNDQIVNGFSQIDNYDATRADRNDAVLLGERQLDFIRDWSADWKDAFMKVALSQTIFANVSTYPDSFKTDAGTPRLQPLPLGVIPKDYSLAKDMDSNGWPQSGRNRALDELRKGFAFMLAGDQHLGSVVHHGIESWEDAGISFCVPSVANVWPRRWFRPDKDRIMIRRNRIIPEGTWMVSAITSQSMRFQTRTNPVFFRKNFMTGLRATG